MTVETTLLAALLAVLSLFAAVSFALTVGINRRHPPEGELVAVAGRKVHIAERRPERGEPAADIVLIHGASATLGDQLLALSDELASRYRVLAVDRPGQGWSDRLAGDRNASPSRQAGQIAEALRRHGVGEAVIIGHSLGAAVAAALALEEPSLVRGLVFLAPASHPWPGGVAWHYRLAALPLLGTVFSFLFAPALGSLVFRRSIESVFRPQRPPADYAARSGALRAITPSRFRANGQDVARLKSHVAALSRRYCEIGAPCVIITGDTDDTVLPSIHSHGLARDIEGAKLVVLEGVGHMPHHARPDAVLAAVDEIVAMRSKAQARLPTRTG